MRDHYFRNLTIWQRSMSFTTAIYALTKVFPRSEQYGLIDQLRRAAISIALNIAEGAGSGSGPEFVRFLHIAKRSAYEVITGLEIAKNLNFEKSDSIDLLIHEADEICAMIAGFIATLRSR